MNIFMNKITYAEIKWNDGIELREEDKMANAYELLINKTKLIIMVLTFLKRFYRSK